MTKPQLTPSGKERAERQPLQQRDDALLADLRSVENTESAKRLERLEGDAEVLLQLQLVKFDPTSDAWSEVQRALIEYGYTVFKSWGVTGLLYQKAAKHGGSGVLGLTKIPVATTLSDDDAHELAVELMLISVEKFRRLTLMNPDPAKRWSPNGGASLRTYFIGRALMELPAVYGRIFAKSPKPPNAPTEEHSNSAENVAFPQLLIDGMFAESPAVKAMFILQAKGYTLDEIAQILTDAGYPSTEGSVRTKMTRARTQLRNDST